MMKRAAIALVLAGCGSPQHATVTIAEPLPTPVKPVTEARIAPSIRAFHEAGCHDEKPDTIDCTGAYIEGVAACREPLALQHVTVDPPAVIALCYASGREGGLRTTGCMLPASVHVIAATNAGFVHMTTKKQFVSTFAPVTSAEEAIAFATILTGDVAYTKPFSPPDGSKVSVAGPQETHATTEGDAFRLRLFHAQMCGCSHPLTGIDYIVARDGTVTEAQRTELWEDTKSMGLCVD